MLPLLPVEIADPVTALHEMHRRMGTLKSGNEAAAGQSVTDVAGLEPFALVSLFIRLAARVPQRNIVTVTTNVPGSPRELAVVGRRILEIFPYVPIAVRLRTGVAALSYCDRMSFGITADFDTSPDISLFAGALERTVATLTAAAGDTAIRPDVSVAVQMPARGSTGSPSANSTNVYSRPAHPVVPSPPPAQICPALRAPTKVPVPVALGYVH
jgi:hypothetical protein